MSLTKDDLQAIKGLLDAQQAALVKRVIKRINELDDTLSLQMEHGLQEVCDQVADTRSALRAELREVKDAVDRIERVQRAEIERTDKHDKTISLIRKHLHAA